eukprot:scaffold10173_cov119-Isochrysis_galbana.AAC.1
MCAAQLTPSHEPDVAAERTSPSHLHKQQDTSPPSYSAALRLTARRPLPRFPLRQVGSLTLFEIAQELARLQRDASAGKLSVADLKGGTFTLSNIGNLGGTYTSPVINQPEIAIAGLGKTRATPRYDEMGNLVKASIMQVGRRSAQPSHTHTPQYHRPRSVGSGWYAWARVRKGGRGGWALEVSAYCRRCPVAPRCYRDA